MLVPRNAQEPEVLKEEFGLTGEDQPESFTVFDASVPRAITIVRIRKIDLSRLFKQSKNIANLDFAREVCQQNYRIVVQNRSGRIITDENQTAYAQKLFPKLPQLPSLLTSDTHTRKGSGH